MAEKHGGTTGYVELGRSGLSVSRLGLGAYRVDTASPPHRQAFEKALREGINLVDTSTNYTDGKSEQLVGEVLHDLVSSGELWRDQVVVVSKIGYAQGRNLELAESRENEGRPFPEMVKVGPGIWHCLHPEWLEDQLGRSLERLGLQTLDVCLLHNPEYFLTDALKRGTASVSELRDELYERMERAFAHFEKEVERGRIRFYGVSSNSSVEPRAERETTELGRMLAAAKKAGGDEHHFRVLELPFNLLEPGAALARNDATETKSVLDLARDERIAVLVNRPLNAIRGNDLVRLADPPRFAGAPDFDAALARVSELEAEFRQTFAPGLKTAPGSPPPDALLSWGDQLARLPRSVATLAQWNDLESQVVLPRVNSVLTALDRAMRGEVRAPWQDWRQRYAAALEELLASIRQRSATKSRKTSETIHGVISPLLPKDKRNESLSKLAAWIIASTPGVTAVLVGMRRLEWVEDLLPILAWDALPEPVSVLEALRNMKLE
jgi:hypothetical protein